MLKGLEHLSHEECFIVFRYPGGGGIEDTDASLLSTAQEMRQ